MPNRDGKRGGPNRDAEETYNQEEAPASAAGGFDRNSMSYFGHGVGMSDYSCTTLFAVRALLPSPLRSTKIWSAARPENDSSVPSGQMTSMASTRWAAL